MDYKTMSDSELAKVMVDYIERVNKLYDLIGAYLTNRESRSVVLIRESYKQLKNELREVYHYLDLTCNRKGSELYKNAFTKSIREAVAYGFTAPVNATINSAFCSSVGEAHYRLKKYHSLEEWENMI